MAIDLLEQVQKNTGYPPLQKIDPNTQEVKEDAGKNSTDRFGQAAIPAVLIGLYKYSRTDEGAEAILHARIDQDWAALIFGDNREEAIDKIIDYSAHKTTHAAADINRIATKTIHLVREKLSPDAGLADVKNMLADERTDILLYLPAELQIGEILHDNTLDDRTHKMEGPVSSLMHAIGGSFSGSDSDETDLSK